MRPVLRMRREAVICVLVVFILALGGCASTVKFQQSTITPAARGIIEVDRDDNNNIALEIQVEHLADPSSLSPPATVYVAWAKTTDGSISNLGQLSVDEDLTGLLTAVTPHKQIQLLVTGEDEAAVDTPSSRVILETKFFDAAKMTK